MSPRDIRRIPMTTRPRFALSPLSSALLIGAIAITVAAPAHAIPAFARKYGTSCLTCHVIYPKLTPFGEAFRRNGYRFPGTDQDFVKMEQIPLGQEQNKKEFPKKAVWPGLLAASVPISLGANGQAILHPDKNSAAAVADNGTMFSLHDLVAEAHIWAGGSITERITFFAQLTFGSDGSVDLEDARVHFNDFFGLKHAFNLQVGKGAATISSFGLHSSYVGDTAIAPLFTTALYGAKSDSWNVTDNYTGLELTGMIAGRVDYSLGVNDGKNVDIRYPANVYGHVGVKIGGMRLDGEGSAGPANPSRPWEETALTLDAFAWRSQSHFTNANSTPQDDTAIAFGGSLRAQIRSFELNAGAYQERHDHAMADGTAVNAISHWDELSYVVFPWLVPAFRLELSQVQPAGGPSAFDLRITPGVAALITANLRLILSAQIEWAKGLAPVAGWQPANGFAMPPAADKAVTEIETIKLVLGYAF
jgi:hypothetical protein